MTPEPDWTEPKPDPVYVLLDALADQLGLPKTYLKQLSDAGQIPYLDSGRHRHYSLVDVMAALSVLARGSIKQAARRRRSTTRSSPPVPRRS